LFLGAPSLLYGLFASPSLVSEKAINRE